MSSTSPHAEHPSDATPSETVGDSVPLKMSVPQTASASPADVRATEEYAAAFDVEVWKAEQKLHFTSVLKADLERQRKELEVTFTERDIVRLEEVDALRRELEAMAKRLNTTGKVLAKRISNHEKREEAFEARRLQHAAEMETQLRNAEERHRRAMDEQCLKCESLMSQIKERDLVVEQSQRRFTVLQEEYDALQRLVGRLQARETSESVTIAELRLRSETMAATIRDMQHTLETKSLDMERLATEREELVAACRLYKSQLRDVTAQYNDVVAAAQAQRERLISEELERLAAVSRQSDLQHYYYRTGAAAGGEGGGGGGSSAMSPSGYLASTYQSPRPAGASNNSKKEKASSEIAALRGLVDQLRLEAERDDSARKQKAARRQRKEGRQRQSNAAASQSLVGSRVRYAEVDSARLFHPDDDLGGRNDRHRSVSPLRVTGSVGEVLFGGLSPMGAFADQPVNDDRRRVVELEPRTGGGDDDDDAVSESTTVSSTKASSSAVRSDQANKQEMGRLDRAPFVKESDQHLCDIGDAATGDVSFASSGGGHYAYVSAPTDNTSALLSSSDEPMIGRHIPSTTTTSSSPFMIGGDVHGNESLPDIREFVRRLKENRDNLIATGVYQATDGLMEDMSKKIRMYEHYLKAHFQ